MKVVAIIQARIGSSRLPGKVLLSIGGKPMLAHVVERVRACPRVDDVVVACPLDDIREMEAIIPVTVFGYAPSGDVLGRYWRCAETCCAADVVLRVTGDCGLWAPEAGAAVLDGLGGHDYANNDTTRSGWPDGCDAEAFTFNWLHQAQALASFADREHVTPIMRRWSKSFGIDPCVSWRVPSCSHVKLSVDTADDLAFVRAVYAALDDPTDYSFDATWRAVEKVRG